MYKKLFLIIFTMLMIVSPVSAQTFSQSGTVSESSPSADKLTVSNKQFRIDHDTVVHGLVPQGEKGPIVAKDTAIGFNTSRQHKEDEPPYITEIWLLNE